MWSFTLAGMESRLKTCVPIEPVHLQAEVVLMGSGSNPARGDAKRKGAADQGAEVFALLWELSSYREALPLSFHFFGDVSRVECLGGKFLWVCLWWRLVSRYAVS
jgi:hypothetical protein